MSTGIISHLRAGTGAVCISTRDESALQKAILAEVPEGVTVKTVAAPGGPLRDAETGLPEERAAGLAAAYAAASAEPGTVVIAYDWHCLCNNPGQWRALIEAMPGIRSPKGSVNATMSAREKEEALERNPAADLASLIIFVAPSWEFAPSNPLRGLIPVLDFAPPDRDTLTAIANTIHPLNGDREQVIDSLCGLSAAAAEQICAEVIQRTGGKYDVAQLRDARRAEFRRANLEVRPLVAEMGGLHPLKTAIQEQIIPWIRDPQLAVRNIICAGQPGTGKTYWPGYLAFQLSKTEPIYFSPERMKAGIVGASGENLRAAMRTVDAMSQHAPTVVLIDELDKLATKGMDSGTSSGMYAELLYWLEYRSGQSIVIASCNDYGEIAAPLARRFQMQWRFDLPTPQERAQVGTVHLDRLHCEYTPAIVQTLASETEGFSSAEIVSAIISAARAEARKLTVDGTIRAIRSIVPVSKAKPDEAKRYRDAAAHLPRANDDETSTAPQGRRVKS